MEGKDGEQQPRTTSFPSSPVVSFREEEQVMSEVHLGTPVPMSPILPSRYHLATELEKTGSTINLLLRVAQKSEAITEACSNNSTSRRHSDAVEDISVSTATKFDLDEDGVLILTRHRKSPSHHLVLTIQHNITSSIPRVGLQVWRAELVLADFVLHVMSMSSDFDDVVALELGAGVDHGDEVLENCEKNVNLNAEIFHGKASVHVRELDLKDSWPPQEAKTSPSKGRYSWTQSEIEELKKTSLLLAADVIYSDDLTDAIFSILEKLMSDNPEKVLYLALEKRYNFTLDDLDVVANGYSHFRSYLITREDDAGCKQLDDTSEPFFVGEQIDLRCIPCYVRGYNRGNDVEIWKIKLNHRALF